MNQVTQQVIDTLYRLTVEAVAGHNLASAAVLLDPQGNIVVELPSRVASSKNALAHADLQVIYEGCAKLNRISLRDYTVVSVFEPSLMTVSACYWASISDIAYFVPAAPYTQKIPWASEGIAVEEKTNIAKTFLEPVALHKLVDPEGKFEKLCQQYVATVVSKE